MVQKFLHWNCETSLDKYQILWRVEKILPELEIKYLRTTPEANSVVECGEFEELGTFYSGAADELYDLVVVT